MPSIFIKTASLPFLIDATYSLQIASKINLAEIKKLNNGKFSGFFDAQNLNCVNNIESKPRQISSIRKSKKLLLIGPFHIFF